jgi:hypothetical protein
MMRMFDAADALAENMLHMLSAIADAQIVPRILVVFFIVIAPFQYLSLGIMT